MTRIEDELQVYEETRKAKSVKDELALLRAILRRDQVRHRWADLQGRIRSATVELNKKAGRSILTVDSPSGAELSVVREDDAVLEIRFSSEVYRAACNFDRCPSHNREYELIVKPIDGNDSTVWADRNTGVSCPDGEIAEYLIVSLLRCAR